MGRLKELRWIVGAFALAALGTVLWFATRPPPLTVQGEVSSDRVDISPRVAGRIAKLQVDVGDSVERGAVITELESPQLVATLIAARAALSVAKADLVRINSTRPETIAARKAELAAAEADVTLNQETYDRKAQLSRGADPAENATDDPAPGAFATVAGKMLAYLLIEAVILPLYLIALPYLYGLPRLGGVIPILAFAVPFVLSISGLGLVVAATFKNPLSVQLVLATIGLPFFYLAGFAWPTEVIPPAVHVVSLLVPSTSAINGFTRLAQLGAPLADVRGEFLLLWGLTLFYGGIAWILEVRRRRVASVPSWAASD